MKRSEEDVFFEDPEVCRSSPGTFGILYLLRRDVNRCMELQILWPGAMGILAGVDLLGKFVAGKDTSVHGQVGKRFRNLVTRYFHVSEVDGMALYQLRNALLHSFGLFSESGQQSYRFRLEEGNKALITRSTNGAYLIHLGSLHTHFENAITEYRNELSGDKDLQTKFAAMYPKYGSIPVS